MHFAVELLLGAAIVHLAWQLRLAWLAHCSNTWPPVPGTLLQCYLDDPAFAEGGGIRGRMLPRARVRYRYVVDGRDYRSSRIAYRPLRWLLFGDDPGSLRALLGGNALAVFHDPVRPSRAVLLRGASRDSVARCVIAVLTCILLAGAFVRTA